MKFRTHAMIGCALSMLTACWEPPYRYDVRGNGEGGVDIQKVPKEQPAPPAAPAPPPPLAPVLTAPAPPQPPPPTPVVTPPSPPSTVDQQQKIQELESRVRQLSAENEKLKQQSTTAPTTRP
jgi:hypothetical protein